MKTRSVTTAEPVLTASHSLAQTASSLYPGSSCCNSEMHSLSSPKGMVAGGESYYFWEQHSPWDLFCIMKSLSAIHIHVSPYPYHPLHSHKEVKAAVTLQCFPAVLMSPLLKATSHMSPLGWPEEHLSGLVRPRQLLHLCGCPGKRGTVIFLLE